MSVPRLDSSSSTPGGFPASEHSAALDCVRERGQGVPEPIPELPARALLGRCHCDYPEAGTQGSGQYAGVPQHRRGLFETVVADSDRADVGRVTPGEAARRDGDPARCTSQQSKAYLPRDGPALTTAACRAHNQEVRSKLHSQILETVGRCLARDDCGLAIGGLLELGERSFPRPARGIPRVDTGDDEIGAERFGKDLAQRERIARRLAPVIADDDRAEQRLLTRGRARGGRALRRRPPAGGPGRAGRASVSLRAAGLPARPPAPRHSARSSWAAP
jgi:hypothetical protein